MYVVSKPEDVSVVQLVPSNNMCVSHHFLNSSCAVTGFSNRILLSSSMSCVYFLTDCGYSYSPGCIAILFHSSPTLMSPVMRLAVIFAS